MDNNRDQLLKVLIDNAEDGVVAIDQNGIILYCNDACSRIFGYGFSELIGQSINVLVTDRHAEVHDSYLINYLKTGVSQIVGRAREIKAKKKDGKTLNIWLSISEADFGEEKVFTGIIKDLTATNRKTDILSENQKRLNAIINTAVDGIITIDEKGIIESANPAAANLFGYTTEEMVGFNVRMLMPEPHHTQHDQYLHNYVTTGIKKIIGIGREVMGLRKDKTTFPFKLSISEVLLKEQRIFTGIVHDLSDRDRAKEIELALTKEKELNELKTRFVSIASHEFRTPLSTISSSASLINRYHSDEHLEKRNKHITRIQSNVRHLTTILNDFLSLSKLEEGKTANQPLFFDFEEFCKEMIEEMQSVSKDGQQILHQHTGTQKVFLDKKLLTNILHNLLSNAIKYSKENQLIHLKSEVKEKEILLEIKDEGIGIPQEEQKQIFGQFFRANNVNNIQGTGLGLNIVKKYVELMDGSIYFDSKENEGTSFFITFPNKLT